MKQSVLPVVVFAMLAFALSWAANRFLPALHWQAVDVKEIILGAGPALSGLICYWLFKIPNSYKLSFAGNKPVVTYGVLLVSVLAPVIVANRLAVVGVVITQFLYTLGEEFGWRHYLQNAVAGFTRWKQAVFIGVVWFFWHYAILNDPTTMLTGQPVPAYIGVPLLMGLLVLLSKFLSDLVVRTQAVLLPVVFHYIGKAGDGYTVLVVDALIVAVYLMWTRLGVGFRIHTKKA